MISNKKEKKNILLLILLAVAVILPVFAGFSGCAEKSDQPAAADDEPKEAAVPAWALIKSMKLDEPAGTTAPNEIYIPADTTEPDYIPKATSSESVTNPPDEVLEYKELISVASQIPAGNKNGEEKRIALTFDDGPGPYTQELLDILAQYETCVTFFVVGERVQYRQQVLQNMIAQGCEIAGHSWKHDNLTTLNSDVVRQDLQDTNTAIFNATGVRPRLYRAPGGSYDDKVREVSGELGMAIIQWSIDPQDWKYRNADTVYNSVMTYATDGAIVVMHDIHATTIEAMHRVIPDLIAAGFKIVTVSEILGELDPGAVYFSEGYKR